MMPFAKTIRTDKMALAAWLRLFVFLVCAAIAAAFAYYEWSTREARLGKAESDALMLAESLGQHAQDTFELIDTLFTGTADRIAISDRSLADIYAIDNGLNKQLNRALRIRSIMAFDKRGRQFISSQPQVPDWFDLSHTDAFSYHASHVDTALRIETPARSPTNGDWIIPVTRRLDNPDGTFGGILVATIRVGYFARFYKSLGKPSGSIISLLSQDGSLLSRYPLVQEMIGDTVSGRLWKSDVADRPQGTLRYASPADGVSRVYGFRHVSDYPLFVFVGLSRDAIMAAWRHDAMIHLLGAIGLIGLLGVMGMRLARHVSLRQSSVEELVKLARTDGLTGLMNRRSFDAAFERAWDLAATTATPLSLLLLDVDHFKAFNDTYGHPAGDRCLNSVATALTQTVYKPADRVARYGGEEFAVLLPATGEASALIVAERIRSAILALAIPHRMSEVEPTLTVSIGVSSIRPGADTAAAADAILKDADRALYKAKLLGRNQVQSSRLSVAMLPALTAARAQAARS